MRLVVFISLFSMHLACAQTAIVGKIEVLKQVERADVLSASGVVSHKGFYYAIGDDSPYLYKLNHDYVVLEKHQIHFELDSVDIDNRLPKKTKPDFEAIEFVGENELLIFGSGSKSPYRNLMIRMDIEDPTITESFRLDRFYKELRELPIMKGHELNIEGAAYSDGRLFLFNRGKNILISLNYLQFLSYLAQDIELPELHIKEFQLPEINGLEAGFSGSTIHQGSGMLIVTASVEQTDNAYDDGGILGSFLGVASLNTNGLYDTIKWYAIQNTSEPLKIESVTLDTKEFNQESTLTLVTDSDGGPSLFLRVRIKE
jgi:hypothetical protein